jgi:hypothetical protein
VKRYLIFFGLIGLLAGCQAEEKLVGKEEAVIPGVIELEDDAPEESVKKVHFPLTGMETDDMETDRPFAVMINNHPKARPQAGLAEADIVYEVLAEGDITRFLAIFHSQKPSFIGPVRSARDYYIDLSSGYDALYISHGWSPEAREMLQSGTVDHLNGLFHDGTLFERVSFKKAPHNSYISSENILKGADLKGYDMKGEIEPLLFHKESPVIEGELAQTVSIAYSRGSISQVKYVYNEQDGRYDRFTSDGQLIDYNTKQPVQADNLFIVEADHRIVDEAGRRDIDLTSGGKGYLIQKGKARAVQWKNTDGKILPYQDGQLVPLLEGSTWINIVPSSAGFSNIVSIQSDEKGA